MELSDLNIFRTVVESGGITRAAEKLNRVQSNVTTRISQLEADLGVKLFIREGKKMRLSPARPILLERGPRWLAARRHSLSSPVTPRQPMQRTLSSHRRTAKVRRVRCTWRSSMLVCGRRISQRLTRMGPPRGSMTVWKRYLCMGCLANSCRRVPRRRGQPVTSSVRVGRLKQRFRC